MTPNRGIIRFLIGGETLAYGTATTPKGILNTVLKALEHRGVSRAQVEARIDLKRLEAAFEAIDAREFEQLLRLNPYNHDLVIVPVEHGHHAGDPGTLLGRVA